MGVTSNYDCIGTTSRSNQYKFNKNNLKQNMRTKMAQKKKRKQGREKTPKTGASGSA